MDKAELGCLPSLLGDIRYLVWENEGDNFITIINIGLHVQGLAQQTG